MNRRSLTRPDKIHKRVVLLAGVFLSNILAGQAPTTPIGDSILQKRYSAAQRFQAANDLVHADEQYRIFLADILGEIASGRAQAGQYPAAQDRFDEALRLYPEFPMMQMEYARAAMRSGDLDHAETLSKDLLQKYPNNPKIQTPAHVVLGQALIKADRNAEAKEQFEAALFLDPTFDNGYELAVANLNLGDVEAARKIFAEMLSSFGNTETLHMYFGQAYGNSDFQSDAVAEFRKALAQDPHLPGAHYSLAVADLASAGDSQIAAAESELREEIAVSPKDAAAYAALGHLLATHGQTAEDKDQAAAHLKRATELDAANPDGFLYLGQFYADQKRIPEAEAALRRSISLTHDVARNAFQVQKAHYLLARLLRQTGDKAEADSELAISQALQKQNLSRDQGRLAKYLGENGRSEVSTEFQQPMQALSEHASERVKSSDAVSAFELRMKPAVADSYNNLGAIAATEEHFQLAVSFFQQAAQWEPSTPGLDFNWGRAAFAAGAYAQAIGPLSRFLHDHPEDDGARRVLGLSQFLTKDYGAAVATLARLASNSAEQPKVRFAYADSLLKTGDARSAMPILQSLQAASPDLPDQRVALAEAYAAVGRHQMNAGDTKGAIANFESAIKLDPGNLTFAQSLKDMIDKSRHP